MAIIKFFSARHREALKQKDLRPSFSLNLRTSIERTLYQHSNWGGYDNENNFSYENASDVLKTFYGIETLQAFDNNKRVAADFGKFIKHGYPSEVLDAIEAWFGTKPNRAKDAEYQLNQLFSIHESPWRVIDGEIVLIDSEYIQEDILARCHNLMQRSAAVGPEEEFHKAIKALHTEEYKTAITEAHKSVESVMKFVLKINEHIPFGVLLSRLIKSGFIPEYYEKFLLHFEQLALGVVKARNQPGTGHGQGIESVAVPVALARYAVNLAASTTIYLLEQWVDRQSLTAKTNIEPTADSEIPF